MPKSEIYVQFIKNIISKLNYKFIFLQIRIIAFVVLFKFFLLGIFYWQNNVDLNWIATKDGLLSIIILFLFFVEILFIVSNISAFIYWICAKKKGGTGTFLETQEALLWTSLYTFMLINLSLFFMNFGKLMESFLISNLACLSYIGSLIFGIVRMSIQTAKINDFHSDRGTNVFLLGSFIQLPFIYVAYNTIINNVQTLAVFLIPATIQFITTIGLIFFGYKILRIQKKILSKKDHQNI